MAKRLALLIGAPLSVASREQCPQNAWSTADLLQPLELVSWLVRSQQEGTRLATDSRNPRSAARYVSQWRVRFALQDAGWKTGLGRPYRGPTNALLREVLSLAPRGGSAASLRCGSSSVALPFHLPLSAAAQAALAHQSVGAGPSRSTDRPDVQQRPSEAPAGRWVSSATSLSSLHCFFGAIGLEANLDE